jgi:hypothetical protein
LSASIRALKTLGPAAPLHEARAGQGAAVAGDGRVVVASGRATGSVEVYDPKKDQWTKVGALAGPVVDPAAVTLANGHVLIAGGDMMWKGAYLDAAYVFETKKDKIRPAAKLPDMHLGVVALRQADGKVALLGLTPGQTDLGPKWDGADAAYDPASDRWVSGPLSDPTAVALRAFVAGPEQYKVHAILRPAKGDVPLLVAAGTERGGQNAVFAIPAAGKPSAVLTLPATLFEWSALMSDDRTVVRVMSDEAQTRVVVCPLVG